MDPLRNPRVPLSVQVVIYCRGLGLVRGRTRQVGVGSMIIDTGIIRLPLDEEVEVAVVLCDGADDQVHQITAKVVRNSELGSELSFRDFEADTIRCLRRVLSASDRRYGRRPSVDASAVN